MGLPWRRPGAGRWLGRVAARWVCALAAAHTRSWQPRTLDRRVGSFLDAPTRPRQENPVAAPTRGRIVLSTKPPKTKEHSPTLTLELPIELVHTPFLLSEPLAARPSYLNVPDPTRLALAARPLSSVSDPDSPSARGTSLSCAPGPAPRTASFPAGTPPFGCVSALSANRESGHASCWSE